jgi:hypothetical protein
MNTFSMQHFDAFISICAMPIGVLICFGPALLFWLKAECGSSSEQNDKK